MHAHSCCESDPAWKCVFVPEPVWVYVLHMALVRVYLHVCLSLCAWTSVCMNMLTPQVAGPYVHKHLGGGGVINSLRMGASE